MTGRRCSLVRSDCSSVPMSSESSVFDFEGAELSDLQVACGGHGSRDRCMFGTSRSYEDCKKPRE